MFVDTKYALSVVYRASVVLIESDRPRKTPLPVLTRQVTAQPSLVFPIPTLEGIEIPEQRPRAVLGDTLTVKGHHLDGQTVKVILENPRQDIRKEFDIIAADRSDDAITVVLPEAWDDTVDPPVAPADWAVGVYTVWAEITLPGEVLPRITNALALMLAPKINSASITVTGDTPNTLAIRFGPKVRSGPYVVDEEDPDDVDLGGIAQRVSLLLGDHEFPPPEFTEWVDYLVFNLPGLSTGDYYVRLRVDGVDSMFIDYTKTPPEFDDTWEVHIP
jgi:hypothetical protein